MISIQTKNKAIQGHLAVPKAGQGEGILVLHAWWGLNEFIKSFSDRLAREGYLVLSPDLFDGQVGKTIEEAEKISSPYDQIVNTFLEDIVDYLVSNPKCKSKTISVIGFSFGGFWSSWLANKKPDEIKKVVLFYANGWEPYNNIKASYLCHYAENDPYEGPENVKHFQEGLKEYNIKSQYYTYPNTHHWFFESDNKQHYNEEASKLAWERTLEFLNSK